MNVTISWAPLAVLLTELVIKIMALGTSHDADPSPQLIMVDEPHRRRDQFLIN